MENNTPLKPLGPLQDADADLLKAIITMTNPRVILEFGYLFGDSSRAMLSVMRPTDKLVSVDKDRKAHIKDERFSFVCQSQETYIPKEKVDFVFLDASHDLELNKKTFENLKPFLTEKAIIAVHDTGTWPSNLWNFELGQETSGGRYAHCPDEIHFVNWLFENEPEYQQIHLHSITEARHGITLVQKKTKLSL
jgi:hypothetical protein